MTVEGKGSFSAAHGAWFHSVEQADRKWVLISTAVGSRWDVQPEIISYVGMGGKKNEIG